VVSDPPDLIMISAIEHYAYCPRQCALIHVDGVWSDNAHTVRGQLGHRRVDYDPSRIERGRYVLRAVALWSERFGLTGRADAVEIDATGGIVPVEYKMGERHGDAAHLQLCAQALCLEEMTGRAVPEGALWFGGPRRRITVQLHEELRSRTIDVIGEVRAVLTHASLPIAPNDERCAQCQLVGHCLPDIVATPERVATYVGEILRCGS